MQNFLCWWQQKKHQFLVLIILGCLSVLFGLGLLTAMTWSKQPILPPLNASPVVFEETALTNSAKRIAVDIGGAVVNPGIYSLFEGERLADLISVAGGFNLTNINQLWLQQNLNLAEILADGKKYYIPYREETLLQLKLSSSVNVNNAEDLSQSKKLISLSTASLKELTTLPGIGEVRAQAIIDGRPYKQLSDLIEQDVLTEKIFDNIKELIAL